MNEAFLEEAFLKRNLQERKKKAFRENKKRK